MGHARLDDQPADAVQALRPLPVALPLQLRDFVLPLPLVHTVDRRHRRRRRAGLRGLRQRLAPVARLLERHLRRGAL
eukprot:scaffold27536_cov63-Phaeocystis_antarctica.AAC.3